MKGMATCKVCGRDFALMIEEHYVVCDPKKTGVMAALVNKEVREFDAFDCPHCGCQYVAQERKPLAVAFEEYPSSDYEDEYTGCGNCKYDYCDEKEEPCNSCRHCNDVTESKFVPKEDK